MDVIVRLNNSPVNDITTPMSGLINDLDKAIKIKSSQSKGSDCRRMSTWIFM